MKKNSTSKILLLTVTVMSLGILGGCLSQKFKGPEKLVSSNPKFKAFSGVEPKEGESLSIPRVVDAETLNVGYEAYTAYCMQCHGMSGEGNGPAAQGMYPPPRNFTQGIFKFVSGKSGDLPADEDLIKTIRYGLRGTHMLPWDLSQERLVAVVQYIKTFALPVWKEGAVGVAWPSNPNPWKGREQEALLLGKKVYHGVAQCYACHPSYATNAEVDAYSRELTGGSSGEMRENPHLSVLQDSSYGHKFMPPDYTKNWIKSLRNHATEEEEIADIYRLLGSGVGGTTMPAWEGVLSSNSDETKRIQESHDRQWALAYYVYSLHKLKFDLEARKKFFEELNGTRTAKSKQPQSKTTK
jgi:mono/diheme cytochrome c family protein